MQNSYPEVSLTLTERRVLESTGTGDVFSISIGLPAGYYEDAEVYPVLYMLDAQWSFGTVLETARVLAGWKVYPELGDEFPEILVVGIGFPGGAPQPNRKRHYVPVDWLDEPVEGGAESLLHFIREDLIPEIESQYRAGSAGRGFMGDSLGGLFGFFALLCRPGLFERYVLGSPWLVQETPAVFDCEREYAAAHDDLAAKVFIGAGSKEPRRVLEHIRQLDAALRGRDYPGLDLETRFFEGETHLSVLQYNLIRGLMSVYT